jgi:hypothetical protein
MTAPDPPIRLVRIPITDLPDTVDLPEELGYALWLEALRQLENRLHLRSQKGYTS